MAEAPLPNCPFLVNLLPEASARAHTVEASLTSPAPSVSWAWPGPWPHWALFPGHWRVRTPPGWMWLLPATLSPGQAQASAVCLPLCIRCCSPSHVLGSLVDLFGLSPVPSPHPALTTSLYPGGAGDLYCESSVHIHTQ